MWTSCEITVLEGRSKKKKEWISLFSLWICALKFEKALCGYSFQTGTSFNPQFCFYQYRSSKIKLFMYESFYKFHYTLFTCSFHWLFWEIHFPSAPDNPKYCVIKYWNMCCVHSERLQVLYEVNSLFLVTRCSKLLKPGIYWAPAPRGNVRCFASQTRYHVAARGRMNTAAGELGACRAKSDRFLSRGKDISVCCDL